MTTPALRSMDDLRSAALLFVSLAGNKTRAHFPKVTDASIELAARWAIVHHDCQRFFDACDRRGVGRTGYMAGVFGEAERRIAEVDREMTAYLDRAGFRNKHLQYGFVRDQAAELRAKLNARAAAKKRTRGTTRTAPQHRAAPRPSLDELVATARSLNRGRVVPGTPQQIQRRYAQAAFQDPAVIAEPYNTDGRPRRQ